MASTDSLPVPRKNVAYRVVFGIYDADGDLVTGAAALDSEVSKDQGTFADCTNEATEIATASGMYYLDLTSTEMNADSVAVIVKTSTVGAKTTVVVLYPQESGDIKVDVQTVAGTTQTARDLGASVLVGDKTGFSLSAAGVQAIWDALTSALTTVGSIGKKIVDNLDAAISSRSSHTAADVWAAITRTLTAATNITSSGGTTVPQTGDSFARLGAAGASLTDLGGMSTAMKAQVQQEAEDALAVTVADSVPADGTRPTPNQALYAIYQFLTERAVAGTTLTVKKPDGSTTLMTFTLSDATTPVSITRTS